MGGKNYIGGRGSGLRHQNLLEALGLEIWNFLIKPC
jgi:hypothetical protein